MSGPLKNARHEKFAQGLAEGKTADQSYADAGYVPNRKNASRLKSKEDVQARVKELQERAQKRHDVTIDSLTRELEEARIAALANSQASAAVSAIMGKARLHGLDEKKLRMTLKKPEDMSLTELQALLGDEEANRIAQEMAASETPTRH
ncbi:MAG: hypothetical protein RIA64_01375 [Rhodospirillales bacterium]